jgi:hypothetical protein
MKHFLHLGLTIGLFIGGMVVSMADANAVVCARGVYRAGCVGRHGAAVVHRGPVYHRRGVVVRHRRF